MINIYILGVLTETPYSKLMERKCTRNWHSNNNIDWFMQRQWRQITTAL